MRPWITPTLITLCLTAIQANAAPPSPGDHEALTQLAQANDMAWDASDHATIATQYAEDGTLRVGSGSGVLIGRERIRAFFKHNFEQRAPGLRHVTKLEHIEMLTPDLALADAYVSVDKVTPEKGSVQVRAFRNSSVAVRENGVWRLLSVRADPVALP